MAVTHTFTKVREDLWGSTRVWFGTWDASGTYNTGGDAFDPKAVFGMATIDAVLVLEGAAAFRYDKDSQSLLMYNHTSPTAGTQIGNNASTYGEEHEEIDNSSDLSSFDARPVIVLGR